MQWPGVTFTFPEELRGQPLQMGIDEAGRGPALGPMVYCGAIAPLSFEFPDAIDDSKALTPEQRESDLALLRTLPVGFAVRSLSAAEVGAKMLSRTQINLNQMSHTTALSLVKKVLEEGLDVKVLYVDTVGIAENYQEWLQKHFPSIKVTVCKKADSIYKVVGAASICAKVTRDKELENFSFEEPGLECEKNWGSGYPSDPHTKRWLEKYFDPVFGYPSIARFSWKPITQAFTDKQAEADFTSEARPDFDSSFYTSRGLKQFNL